MQASLTDIYSILRKKIAPLHEREIALDDERRLVWIRRLQDPLNTQTKATYALDSRNIEFTVPILRHFAMERP